MTKIVTLEEVCEVIAGQSPPSSTYNTAGEGLPFFQGKADFGQYSPTVRIWCNSPQKIAEKGDILISVRAPVGPTNLCDQKACIGRGLSAIRAGNKIDNSYLQYFLKKNEKKLSDSGRGSTFSSITQKDLKQIQIPLPSLEEQKRIVHELDSADALRQKRKQAIALLDNYLKAVFLEMFGDPVTNPKGWEKEKFGNIGTLDRGISKHRPRNAPELLGGDHPLIQTGDVANAGMFIKDFHATYSDLGLSQSKKWAKGTLCITIAANIAKTGILTFDACFPDSVVGFIPNQEKTNNVFMHFWMSFFQKILEANAPESAQKNINLKILRDLNVTVPPIELQNKFADAVKKTELMRDKMAHQSSQFEENLNALMQRSFN